MGYGNGDQKIVRTLAIFLAAGFTGSVSGFGGATAQKAVQQERLSFLKEKLDSHMEDPGHRATVIELAKQRVTLERAARDLEKINNKLDKIIAQTED